jgi:predicted transcriptional regulator
MITRITIDLPQPLAERIHQLANEHMRYPKQEIVWLLQEAVSTSEKSATAPAATGESHAEQA